jgi:hypothetical protein
MPYRGETVRGYAEGMHLQYVQRLILETTGVAAGYPANIVSRYRYNQDVKSIYAMVPAVIPILLIFIPAILMALGVVREKELGSITNLYVTPVTRLEFLLGKQLPYVVVALISFVLLLIQSQVVFHVPIKGSLLALSFGALLYVIATTGIGLLISTFTNTQIAALFGTAILTMLPTVSFSGLTTPVGCAGGGGLLDRPVVPGQLLPDHQPRRLHQGARYRRPDPAVRRAGLLHSRADRAVGRAAQQAGEIAMRLPSLANIFRLGLKELKSLAPTRCCWC